MDGPTPSDAVCVTCQCGMRAIMEPRWFNKIQACAGCQREFMVVTVQEGASWLPLVMFTADGKTRPTAVPTPPTAAKGPWFNVTCTCGRKIGLDRRLAGRVTRCSACGQEILITLAPGASDDRNATRIIRGASRIETSVRLPKVPEGPPPPPPEMHLLCTCGEELLIPKEYYNATVRCGSCGIRLGLHLKHDSDRNRYELDATVVLGP